MGVIARQSIKGALANYLGVIIGFFTTFFVLTDYLTQEEIGLTRVMVDAAMLFSGLAQLGTNASIIRFFPFFKSDDGKNHGIFGWSILIPFIGFALFALFFFLFKERIVEVYSQKSPLIADYVYLLLPLTFFALYLTVFETNASVLLRITVPRLVREVGIRVFNLVCYLLYGKGVISLDMFVLLFCLSYGVAMLINFIYLMSLGRISFRIDWKFIDRARLKEIMLYTLFMTATVLAGNIPLINSLFLGAHTGLALTGVYTIAFYIANIVEVPYRSLGAISRPMVSQAVRDDNWQEVNRLGRQVSLHQFLVSALIFFFIWINLRPLFAVIPHGAEYVGGMGVVFFLGLAKIVNSSLSIGTDILNYSRRYPFSLLFIGVLTASAILLNNYLIPLWSINGAACATLFSYLLYFLCLLIFMAVTLRVNIFSLKHLTVLALMLCLFGLNLLWCHTMTPLLARLLGSAPQLVTLLVEALAETTVMLIVSLTAIRLLHISPSVDRMLLRGMRLLRLKR
ncbi:MAG: oligosaccharide flippase family protein [Bacteroidales bacterium]|nr:oligosaccharide flippase family protein [Bacteroidales bacterium]